MSKVVLVINNFSWFGKRPFRTWLPAVPIITTLLKNCFDFSVIDANVNEWSIERTQYEIEKSGADLILISALSVDYQKQYHKVAEIAKLALPRCKVMMGGVYPTTVPNRVLNDRNIDVMMQGHAEGRLPRIIDLILSGKLDDLRREPGIGFRSESGIEYYEKENQFSQVGDVVKPDYSCIDVDKYFELQQHYSAKNYSTECAEKRTVNIISSYGCRYNCFFCANKSLSGCHIVYRPVEDVLSEIDFFVQKHHVEQVSFMDDNIVADKERAKELFREIIERGYHIEIQIGNLSAWDLDDEILNLLHDAGCTRIGISVESGSQRVLYDIMHKPLDLTIIPPLVKKFRDVGIMMIADFLIGLPGETWEDIRMSLDYAYKMEADLCNINIAVPYPGTELYDYMKSHGLLPDDFQFDEQFYIKGLANTEDFTAAELQVLRAIEWDRINMGTLERRKRAMAVLRLTEKELADYSKQMRETAIRFAFKLDQIRNGASG